MKIIKIIILVTLILTVNQLRAQLKVGADFSPISYSSGSSGEQTNFRYGINLYGKYEFKNNLRVGLNIGFSSKENLFLNQEGKNSMMPISALMEYKFNLGKFSPYIGFETGVATTFNINNNLKTTNSFYAFSPVVGLEFQLTDRLFLNTNARYQSVYGGSLGTERTFLYSFGVGFKF